jgi:tRNA (adenine57-N1/adenine58-N1)-methyltransferase
MELSQNSLAQEGDLAQLVGVKHKHHIIRLTAGRVLQTHRGEIKHDDLIGTPFGREIESHIGRKFQFLEPTISDLINEIPRRTQIMYPKDIGYILVKLGVGPGKRVGEAGTGSGAMTTALAYSVGKTGHVYTYETVPDASNLAKKNLRNFGLDEQVTFYVRNIEEGFIETGLDAFFLDVQNPFDYLHQVRSILKPGGSFGCIAPTTNQVIRLLGALDKHGFSFIEVVEVFLRYYRTVSHRLRPVDRMVAHTGYLVFGRPMLVDPDQPAEGNSSEMETEEEE